MPFLKFFDIIPSWVYAIVIAALTLLCGLLQLEVYSSKTDTATVKTELADTRAAHEKAARMMGEAYRQIDALRSRAQQEINNDGNKERAGTALAFRVGDDSRGLLLSATRSFSSGSATASDPFALTRAERRADTFGELLGQCDKVAADLGRSAEDLATQVRGLQRSYQSLVDTAKRIGSLAGGEADPIILYSRFSDPSLDGKQVDPHAASFRRAVVNLSQPVLALDTGLDRPKGLITVQPQVGL